MTNDDYKRSNRLSPHEEDEEFDWKKADLEEDDRYWVIYPNPSYTPEIKKRITEELGFKWAVTHWENKTSIFSRHQLDELLMDGIKVEIR